MEALWAKFAFVFFIYLENVLAAPNMYDCWDPEKLAKMRFKESRGNILL